MAHWWFDSPWSPSWMMANGWWPGDFFNFFSHLHSNCFCSFYGLLLNNLDNDDSDVDVHNSKRIKNKERKKQTIALQTNDQQIHPCEEKKRKKRSREFSTNTQI